MVNLHASLFHKTQENRTSWRWRNWWREFWMVSCLRPGQGDITRRRLSFMLLGSSTSHLNLNLCQTFEHVWFCTSLLEKMLNNSHTLHSLRGRLKAKLIVEMECTGIVPRLIDNSIDYSQQYFYGSLWLSLDHYKWKTIIQKKVSKFLPLMMLRHALVIKSRSYYSQSGNARRCRTQMD